MAADTQSRILVIRGGAIGDFLLTLPAIALLRENFPKARLEILGYEHIVALAEAGGLADATRSIEYGALAGFFNPKAELNAELCGYFASCGVIVSYLFDPDGFFASNLRRCGVKHLIEASPKIDVEGDHAARQLARPLERLALFLEDASVSLNPGAEERSFAEAFLAGTKDGMRPLVAIHPGAGGQHKVWPAENWSEIACWLLAEEKTRPRVLLVGGEADERAMRLLTAGLPPRDVLLAHGISLSRLAALLARCSLFLGHDSGVSHLAAAVGCPSILLFGPTDPDVWAPPHAHVRVLRAPEGRMAALSTCEVRTAVAEALGAG